MPFASQGVKDFDGDHDDDDDDDDDDDFKNYKGLRILTSMYTKCVENLHQKP